MTSELITFNYLRCHSSSTALGTRTGYWKPTRRGTDETLQCQVTFIFANFANFLKSMKSYLPAFLWISLDIIIVQAPSIYHFKVMRNLQYDIIFSKKSIIKPQWQGQVTLIFADSHVIFRVKLKFWLIYLSEQFIFRRGFNG